MTGTATGAVTAALKALGAQAGLNLLTQSLADAALAEAARQDADGRAAERPLQGLPIVVKANVAVKGALQDGASPALAGNIARADAGVVARLRAAGAIPVALTNMHELAFGITSHNAHYGPVRNPNDPTRMAGGSSGGTAAAIGAGAVRAGVASDTGGSGRLPAAFCGCAGLRPTHGRYPSDGILTLSPSLDTLTVMADGIDLLAALDAAICGDGSLPDIAPPRLGVVGDPFWTGLDRQMTAAGRAALDRLAAAGARLAHRDVPRIEALTESAGFPIALNETMTTWQGLARDLAGLSLADFAERIASPDVRDLYRMMARGEVPPEAACRVALTETAPALRALIHDILDEMDADALVFPTLARTAPPVDETETVEIDGQRLPLFPTLTRRELTASVAGLPAISLPAGRAPDGLPFGLELVGRAGADRHLLAVALWIEGALAVRP